MYLLLVILRLIFGPHVADRWCLQLVRRDGRTQSYTWPVILGRWTGAANLWRRLERRLPEGFTDQVRPGPDVGGLPRRSD
jgi:hypothetical protein